MISKRSKLKLSGFTTFIGHHFACLKRFYPTKSLKHQVALRKGAERLEDALDIKQLIETQADLKIIKNVLFTKHQKRLMKM